MEQRQGVSVVICCYNSAPRLPQTLRHLALQRVPDHLPWEVVIVDNGSTDGTKEVAQAQWNMHAAPAPLRLIDSAPGLVAARNEGLRSARHEFVIFCDDDNWLDADYVHIAHEVMSADADIGVLGGWGEAAFEAEPPPWFEGIEVYFAVGPQAEASGDVSESKGYVYGAAFVVRKEAWLQVARHDFASPLESFRRGSNDKELCSLIRLAGYKMWYEESLRFKHFLPASRLEWRRFLGHAYRAHKTAMLVEPFSYVLAREDYVSPSRWYWFKVASKHALWLLRRFRALLPPLNQEGSWARFRHACYQGKLAGWLHMRWRFKAHCDRIHALQLALQAERTGVSRQTRSSARAPSRELEASATRRGDR